METEAGGDKLKEATIPGRGKKRPPSPASSPSDDGEDYRDTATSRAKKSKSPMVELVNKYMSDYIKIQAERLEYFKQYFAAEKEAAKYEKEAAKSEKIRLVVKLARECGVKGANRRMLLALLMICKKENSMEFFIGTSTPEGRLAFIEHYARDDNSAGDGDNSDESSDEDNSDESSDEEWFNDFILLFDVDDDDGAFMYGMYWFAIHYDEYCNRAKRMKPMLTGRRGRSRYSHKSSQEKRESTAKAIKRLIDTLQAGNNQEANTLVQIKKKEEQKKVERQQKKVERQQVAQEIESCFNKYMSDHINIQAERNEYLKQHLAAKQQKLDAKREKLDAKREKIRIVQQLARECGVEDTNQTMWFVVYRICKEENSMESFIGTSTPEERLAFIEHYARVNQLI